jgi:hypothetical protein
MATIGSPKKNDSIRAFFQSMPEVWQCHIWRFSGFHRAIFTVAGVSDPGGSEHVPSQQSAAAEAHKGLLQCWCDVFHSTLAIA